MLFNGSMVRALLEGRKTQTRRIVTLSSSLTHNGKRCPAGYSGELKPRIAVGDTIWVRETWGYRGSCWSNAMKGLHKVHVAYRADGADGELRTIKRPDVDGESDRSGIPHQRVPPHCAPEACKHDCQLFGPGYCDLQQAYLERFWRSWRPSIHMPRWASRITLNVTDVRAQWLQDISEEDAVHESCGEHCPSCGYTRWDMQIHGDHHLCDQPTPPSSVDAFAALWDDINDKPGKRWDDNPLVWVYTFEVAER